MDNCCKLVHPFQHDPGVSQQQRLVNGLLSGAPKIDGRTLADLLDYFRQLSKNINYYHVEEGNQQLMISDWSMFFQKSHPFLLSSIIKYKGSNIKKRIERYDRLLKRKPSRQALQLILHYIFRQAISPINKWSVELKDAQLPIKLVLEKLIRDKLNGPVEKFVCLSQAAVEQFNVKKIDFSELKDNPLWGFQKQKEAQTTDCFKPEQKSRRKKLLALRTEVMNLVPVIFEAAKVAGTSATLSLNDSFEPMKEEFRQKTPPHLALIFAFLKLFGYLQNDLNGFTKKHLEFFYRDVLKLKALDAVPDKVHILFSIQNQLEKYKLDKGLKLKAGKDENKEEMLFAIEDEIIVNKAQVADVKTLFINNQPFHHSGYIEGIYMAPDAIQADGVKIDFKDDEPKSWPALGAKLSKYSDPETNLLKPYPNARLGFVLASPVLYLQEGLRTVDVTIACEVKENCAGQDKPGQVNPNKCCDQRTVKAALMKKPAKEPKLVMQPVRFLDQVARALRENYYHLYLPAIPDSFPGLRKSVTDRLKGMGKRIQKQICYCPTDRPGEIIQFTEVEWREFTGGFSDAEKEMLNGVFKPKHLLKIFLSGETEWIEPSDISPIEFFTDGNSSSVAMKISLTLKPDKPAVTFFNSAALKEEIKTEWPVIKIELDDSIKMEKTTPELLDFLEQLQSEGSCCINKKVPDRHIVSFYHFFRNLVVVNSTTVPGKGSFNTGIDVAVCGLTKFIVQNDESLQDVNGAVFPFGTRPDVIDFSAGGSTKVYCITKEFIADADAANISDGAKNYLQSKIDASKGEYQVGITKSSVEEFLKAAAFSESDRAILQTLFSSDKNYCYLNLIGPNFYIGCEEIFNKNWNKMWLNINWKDKPNNFNDYYKGYLSRQIGNSKVFGLNEEDFQVNLGVLEEALWNLEKDSAGANVNDRVIDNTQTGHFNRQLFLDDRIKGVSNRCKEINPIDQMIEVDSRYFNLRHDFKRFVKIEALMANTPHGFLKLTMENQDFLHKDYSYVLARQMMALGMLASQEKGKSASRIEDAIYYDRDLGELVVFSADTIKEDIENAKTMIDRVQKDINEPGKLVTRAGYFNDGPIPEADAERIRHILLQPPLADGSEQVSSDIDNIKEAVDNVSAAIQSTDKFQAIIPNEPWTPVIKRIFLDYTATAGIGDIGLIHLYPYKDTFKEEDIEKQPPLFPVFCDEGNLFIGLKDLVPGSNVSVLFQLSEATADSELDPTEVRWYYLENNIWKRLRQGFEVITDETNNLTASGIIRFAMPENMTKENSVLPKQLHWIRASIEKNSRQVCEIIGIHTQAVKASFESVAGNDLLRLAKPLPGKTISSLEQPDSSIKKIDQPYDTFGGDVPELEGKFFIRVSELLRHKGRAIQKWDYERIILQAFPQIFKAKCITHSFGLDANRYDNDIPVAPGYILVAVIPDLKILKAAKSFEPKAPLSLLEKIEAELKPCMSPFVRLRLMNPRYEKVNFCAKVKLLAGKDEIYYKEKLAQDIREFMAPWAIGEFSKLHFGQCINRADVIQFIETRDYVDFIIELRMWHERDSVISEKTFAVCPHTPRSILIAGEVDVCIPDSMCEKQEGECDAKPIPIVDYCKNLTS